MGSAREPPESIEQGTQCDEQASEPSGEVLSSLESSVEASGGHESSPESSLVTVGSSAAELASSKTSIQSREAVLAYLESLGSTRSRETARWALRKIARLLSGRDGSKGVAVISDDRDSWLHVPWVLIGARETALIQAALLSKCAPNTSKLVMHMLKGVIHQCWRLGFIDADRRLRAVSTSAIKGSRLHGGRSLSKSEVSELRAYIASLPSPYSVQVWCIFAVALAAGLRRNEMASLLVTSLEADGHLRVMGKGSQERRQSLPPGAKLAIQHWMQERAKLGVQCDSLFIQISSHGHVKDAGFSGWSIWRLIRSIGEQSGIQKFVPHDLRRTYASRMLDITDLSTVQKSMGHKSMVTTALYDKRGEVATDRAVELLDEWGEDSTLDGAAEAAEALAAAAPVRDLAWVQRQARGLDKLGYSEEQIANALTKSGVKKTGGVELTAADVGLLLR